MTRKIINITDPGDSTHWGSNDADYINKLLTGVDQSGADPVTTNTTWTQTKAVIDSRLNTLKNIGNSYYYISFDGTNYTARNQKTGVIDSTNTDAATVIQYALTNSQTLGDVFLTPGVYQLSTSLHPVNWNVLTSGSEESTQLKPTGNFPAIIFDVNAKFIEVDNIIFTHNQSGYTSSLLQVKEGSHNIRLNNLHFYDNDWHVGTCIEFFNNAAASLYVGIYDIRITDCEGFGFAQNILANITNITNWINEISILNCTFDASKYFIKSNVSAGTSCNVDGWEITNCDWQYDSANPTPSSEAAILFNDTCTHNWTRFTSCMMYDLPSDRNAINTNANSDYYLSGFVPDNKIGGSGFATLDANGSIRKNWSRSTTETLTNKTMDVSLNTIKNIGTAHYTIYVDPSDSKVRARNGVTGVVDYTATTTSATDATACVQSALNNLTGGRTYKQLVRFIGSFTLTTVNVPSYTALDFRDALITQANATNAFLFVNSDQTNGNTQIEYFGGTVDGNRAGQSGGGASYDTWNTFQLVKVTSGTIHDMNIINSNGVAVRPLTCIDIEIYNCFFTNANQTVIDALNGSRIICANNRFITNDEGSLNSANTTDFIGIGNYINGSGTTCVNLNGARSMILNNIIRNATTYAISMNSDTVVAGWDSSGSVIEGNRIDSCPAGGILVGNVTVLVNLIIKGNIIQGVTTATDSNNDNGIRYTDSENCIIDGNIIYDWAANGILLDGFNTYGFARHNVVSNNICYNNGRNTGNSAARVNGIAITGDNVANNIRNSLHGNICYDNASSTQKYGIYVITTTDNKITENDLRGNATGGINDAGGNVNLTVLNNLGYNPVGVITNPFPTSGAGNITNVSQAAAVPASTTVQTVVGTPKTIIQTGGTVTVVAIDGTTVATAAGNYTFKLGVGETYSVTYSGAPTVKVYCE